MFEVGVNIHVNSLLNHKMLLKIRTRHPQQWHPPRAYRLMQLETLSQQKTKETPPMKVNHLGLTLHAAMFRFHIALIWKLPRDAHQHSSMNWSCPRFSARPSSYPQTWERFLQVTTENIGKPNVATFFSLYVDGLWIRVIEGIHQPKLLLCEELLAQAPHPLAVAPSRRLHRQIFGTRVLCECAQGKSHSG